MLEKDSEGRVTWLTSAPGGPQGPLELPHLPPPHSSGQRGCASHNLIPLLKNSRGFMDNLFFLLQKKTCPVFFMVLLNRIFIFST